MLTIRQEQLDALREARLTNFENRMVAHLWRLYPAYAELLDEDSLRAEIGRAARWAQSYGMRCERDLCLYIDVAFAFGRDFDTDPSLPWAAAILNEPALPNPTCRINRLHDTAIGQADKARGIVGAMWGEAPAQRTPNA